MGIRTVLMILMSTAVAVLVNSSVGMVPVCQKVLAVTMCVTAQMTQMRLIAQCVILMSGDVGMGIVSQQKCGVMAIHSVLTTPMSTTALSGAKLMNGLVGMAAASP